MLNVTGLTSRASNSILLCKHLSDNLLTLWAWLQMTVTPGPDTHHTCLYNHAFINESKHCKNTGIKTHSCIYRYKNTWAQWYKHISKIIAWISWKTGLTSRCTKGQDTTTTIQMIAKKKKKNKKTNKPDAAILTANNSILPCGVDVHVIQSSLPHYVMSTRELCSLLCLFWGV